VIKSAHPFSPHIQNPISRPLPCGLSGASSELAHNFGARTNVMVPRGRCLSGKKSGEAWP
jgi:hypothetical protein